MVDDQVDQGQDTSRSDISSSEIDVIKGEVTALYCSTEKMITDYYTKPFDGKAFIKLKDQILGIKPIEEHVIINERVGTGTMSDERTQLKYYKMLRLIRKRNKIAWVIEVNILLWY